MSERPKTYNQLLATVIPPAPIWDATLWSADAIAARETLFDDTRRALEARLYPRAVDLGLTTRRLEAEATVRGTTDVWDELGVAWRKNRYIPVAYALETIEAERRVVRFGVYPVGRIGQLALSNLNKTDDKLEGFIGY